MDTNWKDKPTAFDGKSITYDAIGNPLTYNGYTYTWEEGRQLKTISRNGITISYKYNDAGIRTEKTINGVTTKYRLVGDRVTFETNGTDSIYYTYDSTGNLISMNLNGTEYYYIRNGQGDIIGLIDGNKNQVVSYTYDSWGKLISIGGSQKDTVGVKDPYRYRGYRYDTETGLYYLQSRYYSPEWGRFVNADSIIGKTGDLLGHNMFAYCRNNTVNMEDQDGDIANFIVGALIGIGTQTVADFISGKRSDLGTYASAVFTGALSGGTSGIAIAARIMGGAVVKQAVNNLVSEDEWSWNKFGTDVLANSIGEAVSGASNWVISKYQYKLNYSQTANKLRKAGKYNGMDTGIVRSYLTKVTNRCINIGKAQNYIVSSGYAFISNKIKFLSY